MWNAVHPVMPEDVMLAPMPRARFHPDHLRSGGAVAPDGRVLVYLTCAEGDCGARPWRVEVVTHAGGVRVLAGGEVTCTGEEVLHELPMTARCPRLVVQVVLRFTCGDGPPVSQPFPSRVFVVNDGERGAERGAIERAG